MSQQVFKVGVIGAVMCGLAACSPNTSVQSEPIWTPQALLGSQWVDAGPLVGENPVSLDIASDAGISGNAGCNQYMGKAEISGSSLRLTHNAATRMFCIPQEVMDTESRFWEALNQTRSAKKDQGLLLLVDESGKVLWRFKPRG